MSAHRTFLKFYAIFLICLVLLIGMTIIVVWLGHHDQASEEKLIPIPTGANDTMPELAPGIEKTATRLAKIDVMLTATSITATTSVATPLSTSSVNQ